jgi:hypothetical protein
MEGAEQKIDILNKEITVFEIEQKTQIHGNRENKEQFSLFFRRALIHPFHKVKVKESGGDDYKDKTRSPPAVEHNAGE